MKLLSRDDFRNGVFERDKHTCVFCDAPAADAHHILERRLWPDGGYYLSNGASVCNFHHIECEKTTISVEEVRDACGITKATLPPHLYSDQIYDKWGNVILPNGQRLKGELFFDESVQKILGKGGVLDLFTDYMKYPRTYHLPWSQGMNDDDRMMPSTDAFIGRRVIVTEKMDGENTTMYPDYIHARSVTSEGNESRSWVSNFRATIGHNIPDRWRVCGENMYAEHSISYNNLDTYFYGFSIWDDKNTCLSWDDTIEWFELLDITPVPILYDGIYNESLIKSLWDESRRNVTEGYVLRIADSFEMHQFRTSCGKFVRKNHIQTGDHWLFNKRLVVNKLKS